MPRTRPRITGAETKANCDRLLRLRQKGIEVGETEDLPNKPARFKFQQVYPEFARIYMFANGQVTFAGLAKLAVLRDGVMFTDRDMIPSWDEFPLDLSDPREHECFEHVIKGFPTYRPPLLNNLLVDRTAPLRRCQHVGVIIATGWSPVPASFRDEDPVSLQLWLKDELGNETVWELTGRVDRSFIRKYERKQQERRLVTPMPMRGDLYGTRVRPSDPISISPKAQVSTKRDTTGSKPERLVPTHNDIYRSTI